MTTAGEIVDSFPLPDADTDPTGLAFGLDGLLYVARHSAGSIARMTLDGTVTRTFRVPSGGPDSLANGPDGALWFPQGNVGRIGRLDIGADPPVTAAGTTFHTRALVPFARTVATFADADPNARPSDYDVSIAWDDGTRSSGFVRRAAGGGFEVRGLHVYFEARTHRVIVRITDGVGKGPDAKVESRAIVSG